MGKEVGKTMLGNRYIILQDSPTYFHITVDVNGALVYDHLERPGSIDEIRNKISELEQELLSKNPIQNNT